MRTPWMNAALPALCLVVALTCALCAQPRYYQDTGRSCSFRHADPAGGPGLTATGSDCRGRTIDDRSSPMLSGRPPAPEIGPADIVAEVPADESDGDAAGVLAVGFGLTSFCLLAYRRRG